MDPEIVEPPKAHHRRQPVSRAAVGVIAAAVALLGLGSTGGAVAGSLITGKQIRNNSVTGADIKNGTITKRDLAVSARPRPGAAGASGERGPAGPAGAQGEPGSRGPRGASAWDVIPTGTQLRGSVEWDQSTTGSTGIDSTSIALPGRTPSDLADSSIRFGTPPGPGVVIPAQVDPACDGTADAPTAPPGKVCVYLRGSGHVKSLGAFGLQDEGFALFWLPDTTTAGVDYFVSARWAYTAP